MLRRRFWTMSELRSPSIPNALSSDLASCSVGIRPSPLASAEAVGGPSENCAELRRIAQPRCARHTWPPPLRNDFQVGDRSGDFGLVDAVARQMLLLVRHCIPFSSSVRGRRALCHDKRGRQAWDQLRCAPCLASIRVCSSLLTRSCRRQVRTARPGRW